MRNSRNGPAQAPGAPSNRDGRRGSPSAQFAMGVLLVALGAWFLLPSIQETKDLEHGVRTIGTLLEEPTDCSGGCRVRFDAAGTSVVAELPAHELLKKFHAGSSLKIRYLPENPERVALDDNLGRGSIILGSLIPLMGSVLIVNVSAEDGSDASGGRARFVPEAVARLRAAGSSESPYARGAA